MIGGALFFIFLLCELNNEMQTPPLWFVCSSFLSFFLETGSHSVAQADLELTIPQAGLKLVTALLP